MENIKSLIKHNMRQYGMLMALVVIMVVFQITTNGILLMPANVHSLIMQNSYILILAVGMVLCILTGGNIDLSVGSIVALVSASSALFSVRMGMPVGIAIVLALGIGLLAGMWQGFWIAYVKIPSFIVTLSGMLVFRGINNLILRGETIGLPQAYVIIGSQTLPDFIGGPGGLHITTVVIGILASIGYIIGQIKIRATKQKYKLDIGSTQFFLVKLVAITGVINFFTIWLAQDKGLPYVLILLSILVAIYTFITQKTVYGRHIYALGGNSKAAALSGVKTKKVLFAVYANMGFLAAVAGIVFAGRLNAASPLAGQSFELDAIAACFIGGASATGGVGTVVGAIIGGFIMGVLNNGMSIMGISTFVQAIVKGLVLLAAVAFDVYSKSKQASK